jgi:tRNA(Met) C34 N-acetyltransferase TmcA
MIVKERIEHGINAGRHDCTGRETGVIVFDGFAGFDIDALDAVGGSIRGGWGPAVAPFNTL